MIKIVGLPIKNAIFFLIAFAIAFTLYCSAWPDAPISSGDSPSYIDLGIKFKNGEIDSPQFRIIGYPIFLLMTGSIPHPVRTTFYVQIILHFICIWILAYILYKLTCLNNNYLLNIFCIILLLPPYVESSGHILTEDLSQLTLVLVFGSIFLWYENKNNLFILFAGIFCAVSFLVRPTYIILCFALLPLLIIYKNNCARILACAMSDRKLITAVCLLILPTIFTIGSYYSYNYYKFGYLGITPRIGFQLFTKTINFIEEIPDNQYELREAMIAQRNESLIARGSSHTGLQFIFGKSGSINNFFSKVTKKRPEELDKIMLYINLHLILKKPLNYFSSVVNSFSTIWFPSLTRLSFFGNRPLQLIMSLLHFIFIIMFFLYLSFYMVRKLLKWINKLNLKNDYLSNNDISTIPFGSMIELTAIIIIIYTAIISSAVDVGNPRHLQPVFILIWLLIFIFVGQWHRMNKKLILG